MVTFQIANMEKSGLTKKEYENPEYLADYICSLWENSGKGRKAGVVVCVSLCTIISIKMVSIERFGCLQRIISMRVI